MYTKRLVNKTYVDNNAYITVGDPFIDAKGNPFRAPKKGEKLKGLDIPRMPKNAENGMFSKLTYQGGGYTETIKYKPVEGDDRKGFGFGSKDASRRDEFSSDIRTQQYRETLVKEQWLMNKSGASERLTKLLAERSLSSVPETMTHTHGTMDCTYGEQVPQYDIGRTRVTPFNPNATKDAYYRFDTTKERRLGPYRPVSHDVGESSWEIHYKPPQHGGKSEVKNFFDKSHLSVNSPQL